MINLSGILLKSSKFQKHIWKKSLPLGLSQKRGFKSSKLTKMMPFLNQNEDQSSNTDGSPLNIMKSIFWRCLETGLITFSSFIVLVLGGVVYHKYYKDNVLEKIRASFNDNNILSFVKHKHFLNKEESWANREQQQLLDDVISGKVTGKYLLLVGEKGTGKTSAVLEAMNRANGKDCAVIECSSDVELMRLRIGKSLHFEFSEDYIGSLFSMKGPRDTIPILDIERAFMKLEEILIERKKKTRKPLILIFNNAQLIDQSLVELFQQKAETFASSGMLSMIFMSDEYWLYEKFKNCSTRLELLNFSDVSQNEAIKIITSIRKRYDLPILPIDDCKKLYRLIGGRPQHLNQVASSTNVYDEANRLIDSERSWFLTKCGLLGADMDDDVIDEGKFAVSAMLLMREFVEMDRRKSPHKTNEIYKLPKVPLWRANQIMTRSDLIEEYDRLNIFTIDTDANVRADSVAMMRAFHEIADNEFFDKILSDSIDRVSEIESINRTKEVVMKDLLEGGKYKITRDADKNGEFTISLEGGPHLKGEDLGKPFAQMELHSGERKLWWSRRMDEYHYKHK